MDNLTDVSSGERLPDPWTLPLATLDLILPTDSGHRIKRFVVPQTLQGL